MGKSGPKGQMDLNLLAAMTGMLLVIVGMGVGVELYKHKHKGCPAACSTDTECMERFGGDGGPQPRGER